MLSYEDTLVTFHHPTFQDLALPIPALANDCELYLFCRLLQISCLIPFDVGNVPFSFMLHAKDDTEY